MNEEGEEGVAKSTQLSQSSQAPSFLRRLAGQSVHKAGLLPDQTEIQKRIAEVSRGTKHYENEKRRDKEWTERINKILERRDELLRTADIPRVEAKVDKIFAEMEAKRDLTQSIVHVDMDAFYANVEMLYNPDLAGKPFAVVGLGIVTTASYEARKYGARSGMPEFVAKALCKDLLIVPVDYKRVGEQSRKVMLVLRDYDPNMYIAGCDEAYLNLTTYLTDHNMKVEDCVQQLRDRVHKETGLTASAGIAPNVMLAKICSDRNKPNGQFHLPFNREDVLKFIHELPVRKVPYIGRVGERVLESIGIKTVGDIAKERAIIHLMPRRFAVDFLFSTYLGLGMSKLQSAQREERKSVGASRTFRPVDTEQAIWQKLEYIASLLERDLEAEGWTGKTVTLTFKLDTFQVFTRMKSFSRWISKKEDLFKIGKELLKPELPLRIRLLGLRVSNMKDLRAPEDQGIKKYFHSESEKDASGSPSKKKRKVEPEPEQRIHDVDSGTESATETIKDEETQEEEGEEPEHESQDSPVSLDLQICPICGREMRCNNATLNEHVDWCLSKGTIMDATSLRNDNVFSNSASAKGKGKRKAPG
ncbi:DNA/RNA polymerase [Schizopora paradoxa]|uniref:DNA polymerase kappa n=1 Tax=Schizopora paradoxa TaxID=27342 RepID=A0A0H2RQN8_9AGAM|nr:DNA/RNA polymerase [Schizopora paradoxa]